MVGALQCIGRRHAVCRRRRRQRNGGASTRWQMDLSVPARACAGRGRRQGCQFRLQESNPHGVNVIHVDPPVARDIDHHHGPGFLRGKYNIGYFAWELPEFPDAWMPSLDYFDEIWCPSNFVSDSIALKSPIPVLTMAHAIGFERPGGDPAPDRESTR